MNWRDLKTQNLPTSCHLGKQDAEKLIRENFQSEMNKVVQYDRYPDHVRVWLSDDQGRWVETLRGQTLRDSEGNTGIIYDQDPVFICGYAHLVADFKNPSDFYIDRLL